MIPAIILIWKDERNINTSQQYVIYAASLTSIFPQKTIAVPRDPEGNWKVV